MIVTAVRVEGFRCFVRPTEVRGFSPGLNVVFAPNGTGKSTLFEAIRRALIDHHSVQGVEAEKMRPWGRSLAPTVTVEFRHAGVGYLVRKRILDGPECELARWEGDGFVAVDRGERADERVRALLSRPTAPKGLAKEAHWGLAQALWAPQGAIELGPLGPELATRVRETLAAQIVGGRGGEIERLVEARYRAFFTPQTGKLRGGKRAPELVRKDEDLAAARAAVERAKDAHARTALAQERVQSLRVELAACESERARFDGRVDALRGELRSFDERERAALDADARARESEASLRASNAKLDAWKRARETLAQCERSVGESELSLAVARARLDEVRAQSDALSAAELDAHRAHEALSLCDARWRAADERARARESLARDEQMLAASVDAERALQESQRARDALDAPTMSEVDHARASLAKKHRAEATLDALSIELELRATSASGGESPDGPWAIRDGESLVFRGFGALSLSIEGVGALSVRGPVSERDVSEARAALDESTRALDAVRARWGEDDPSTLDALRARRAELDAHARACDARWRALGGPRARAECERRIERARATLTGAAQSEEESLSSLTDALHDARAAAERAGDPRSIARDRRASDDAVSERASAVAVAIERLAQRTESLTAAKATWASLEAGGSEASAADAREQALLSFDAARAAAERARQQLDGRADAERALALALAALRRAEAEREALRDALRTEEGRLEELSLGANFTALARAEEDVARLEADTARGRFEADAVKLLRDTLVRCRDEAVSKVSGEVERAAERILSRIAGLASVRVELGETFAPSRARVSDGEGEGVALEWLSGGEREQVHFSVRLALAEVLAREERPMVVLDDVLVATDSERLRRVIAVLEDVSARMQVIVLTCHPERYAGAEGAARIDLGAAARAR